MTAAPNPAIRYALDTNQGAPGLLSFAITPADATDFTTYARSIYVGGAGNITIVNLDGSTCLFSNVPAGFILPVCCRGVNLTGTTATNLVGLA